VSKAAHRDPTWTPPDRHRPLLLCAVCQRFTENLILHYLEFHIDPPDVEESSL
jgi:hypothetical protein